MYTIYYCLYHKSQYLYIYIHMYMYMYKMVVYPRLPISLKQRLHNVFPEPQSVQA